MHTHEHTTVTCMHACIHTFIYNAHCVAYTCIHMHNICHVHGGTHCVGLADVGTGLKVPPVNLVDDRGLGQLHRKRHQILSSSACTCGACLAAAACLQSSSLLRCYREEIVVSLQLLLVRRENVRSRRACGQNMVSTRRFDSAIKMLLAALHANRVQRGLARARTLIFDRASCPFTGRPLCVVVEGLCGAEILLLCIHKYRRGSDVSGQRRQVTTSDERADSAHSEPAACIAG